MFKSWPGPVVVYQPIHKPVEIGSGYDENLLTN